MTGFSKFPSSHVVCYVALGSNLGDSITYLQNALDALGAHPEFSGLVSSDFYQSKPHGPQDQPDYFNAAVSFETTLNAEALLDVLQGIENQNKRIRKEVERWSARTLDLDLLLYGDQLINSERLTVPHPRICERAFVLFPLRDIVTGFGLNLEDLKITKKATLKDCIETLSESELKDIKKIPHDEKPSN